MKYILGLLLLLSMPSVAQATNYGPFICTDCPLTGNLATTPDGETEGFIRSIGNLYVSSGRIVPGDSMVVCNGRTCATYTWKGFFYIKTFEAADPGGPYRNQRPPTNSNGGGGAFNGGGTVSGGYGIIGFRAVTRTGETCNLGVCTTTTIVVYEPIYGYYTTIEP
jgi:hypothetical protein